MVHLRRTDTALNIRVRATWQSLDIYTFTLGMGCFHLATKPDSGHVSVFRRMARAEYTLSSDVVMEMLKGYLASEDFGFM